MNYLIYFYIYWIVSGFITLAIAHKIDPIDRDEFWTCGAILFFMGFFALPVGVVFIFPACIAHYILTKQKGTTND